jgi:hypothetical protein
VEDARGFKFPVPSEFDYDMLDNIIRHRFKEGAGSRDVVLGNYEFCKTNMRSATITGTGDSYHHGCHYKLRQSERNIVSHAEMQLASG